MGNIATVIMNPSNQAISHLGYTHKTCIGTPRKLSPTVDCAWSFSIAFFSERCMLLICFYINLKGSIYPICACGQVIRKNILSTVHPLPHLKGDPECCEFMLIGDSTKGLKHYPLQVRWPF